MLLKTKSKIALARCSQIPIIIFRRLFGLPLTVRAHRYGINWLLDLSEVIDFVIFLTGRFEHGTVKRIHELISAGDTVIDIGANIGAHTLPLAKVVGPSGCVIALEPTEYAFKKLTNNITLNPQLSNHVKADQVMLVKSANATLESQLYSSWPLAKKKQEHEKHRGRLRSTQGARAVCLDDYVRNENIDNVKLVKIDVDGFEIDVLYGGGNFFKSQKPVIVMEFAPYTLEERGESISGLISFLISVGYQLQDLKTGAPLPLDAQELASLVPDGGSINIVAQ